MIFHDLYGFFVEQCSRSGKKVKSENKIIYGIVDEMVVFKIFVNIGKEFEGSKSSFFHEKNGSLLLLEWTDISFTVVQCIQSAMY